MKAKPLIALVTILGMAFVSCGGDDGDNGGGGSGGGGGTTSNIILRTQSISNGSEVDAASTTVLTLTYNTTVKVTSNADITLNGSKVTAKSNATTTMAVDIPLSLKDGTAYTVKVTKGAIVSSTNNQVSAPEVTVTFSTRAKAQPVNPDISSTPVCATTDAAKRLYSYMVSQYGQKIISSVMANVNWNNEEAERIGKAVGKYPAMNCYDFIHICFSPANWIDYTNINPVQQWVNAGGLVSLMWHFNVPKSEGSTDVTCTPSETTFRAKNVFTDGTWENKWFYGQMDKVVATMLKLQEAGIAATWRPFHEAAGNATYKQQASWTKSWFWWGYDGAETYKKLWVTMFNYFQEKGIRNLIWVWTTQNYNGNSSQYNQDRDWYPGDQYVDIVARDLYGYNADQNLQEFSEIQATYPTKMVILGECGKDATSGKSSSLVSELWNKGAHWGSFMVWYGANMEGDAWWKDALNCSQVITRETVKIEN
ncbi:MAG: beta-mannosidase [Prevotella sp.]|nr:beta-mannosidase [Prevotella sp.]MBR1506027.1 beta-mannosidase [Prevotella sp.]